jgi:hypothetical protein
MGKRVLFLFRLNRQGVDFLIFEKRVRLSITEIQLTVGQTVNVASNSALGRRSSQFTIFNFQCFRALIARLDSRPLASIECKGSFSQVVSPIDPPLPADTLNIKSLL